MSVGPEAGDVVAGGLTLSSVADLYELLGRYFKDLGLLAQVSHYPLHFSDAKSRG